MNESIEENYDSVIEDFTPYKTEEVTSKLENKINAKYDEEIKALENENNSENISEKEWNDFVDNNNVSERILNIIANKIINKHGKENFNKYWREYKGV